MATIRVLLACGEGASSGFMAQNINRYAKKAGIDLKAMARSESLIDNYADETDVILLAPHLSAELEEVSERMKDRKIPVGVIKSSVYGMLDGEGVVKQVMALLNDKGE